MALRIESRSVRGTDTRWGKDPSPRNTVPQNPPGFLLLAQSILCDKAKILLRPVLP